MNAWMINDLKNQFLTIGITACPEEWRSIDSLISYGEVCIETDWKSETTTKSNNLNVIQENLKYLKILIDDPNQSDEFAISINDSMLIIQGSRESLSLLQDLADEFAKDDGSGQHVHLSYLDYENSSNWFSNKNIELILAVKSNDYVIPAEWALPTI